MCDRSDQLIAWLDCELPEPEAAELERHVQECAECRRLVDVYKGLDKSLEAYCDTVVESRTRRARPPRWVPTLIAAAAAIVLLLLYPRDHSVRRPSEPSQAAAFQPTVLEAPMKAPLRAMPAPIGRQAHKRYRAASLQSRNANWVPTEPTIQIAIPAEAMFAPGAVPQGVSFAAELRLAADGSAQQLRLQP
jgi:hypothetical protein